VRKKGKAGQPVQIEDLEPAATEDRLAAKKAA
jgi:hypothetical protein